MNEMTKNKLSITVVGKDFLKVYDRGGKQPKIDSFLDYRNAVSMKRDLNKSTRKMEDKWFEQELEAIDEIIKILTPEELGNTKI